jgi:hypothetical protein
MNGDYLDKYDILNDSELLNKFLFYKHYLESDKISKNEALDRAIM